MIILADKDKLIPRPFIVEASRMVRAFLDRTAFWVNQLGPSGVKKGCVLVKQEPGGDPGWVIDMKEYDHFKCQTPASLSKCQGACVTLFNFLASPYQKQAFPFAPNGKNCINRYQVKVMRIKGLCAVHFLKTNSSLFLGFLAGHCLRKTVDLARRCRCDFG